MNELALFAGSGGGILGSKLLGWRTVCAVERDGYARDVLVSRQNDGCLDPFPIWDDVCTFDGNPWRGLVDVVSGGFPCQDISSAGRGAGIGGTRSGLWKEMARIIGEVRPAYVWVENSPLLVSRGLGLVLADLAALGFAAQWGIVGAMHAGAPHRRERIWIIGRSDSPRVESPEEQPGQICESWRLGKNVADTAGAQNHEVGRNHKSGRLAVGRREQTAQQDIGQTDNNGSGRCCEIRHAAIAGLPHGTEKPMGQPGENAESQRPDWWATEPELGRVANGVACRVDRLRCIGNGQVPAVVELAWQTLGVTEDENS